MESVSGRTPYYEIERSTGAKFWGPTLVAPMIQVIAIGSTPL